jgi:hypothetical protein
MNTRLKTFAFILSVLALAQPLLAQEQEPELQTLLGSNRITFGGYGGPQVGFTKFDSRDVWLVGGRGGVLLNHSLVIGGGGFGIVNSPRFGQIDSGNGGYLEGGYGGMLVEPILWWNRVVHLSVPVLVGAGGMAYVKSLDYDNDHDRYNDNLIDSDPFFVLEPGIELELNVVRFMRIAAGVKYRWAPNLDLSDTPSDPFNGFTTTICVKFGKF